jgi:hypothetical protein
LVHLVSVDRQGQLLESAGQRSGLSADPGLNFSIGPSDALLLRCWLDFRQKACANAWFQSIFYEDGT